MMAGLILLALFTVCMGAVAFFLWRIERNQTIPRQIHSDSHVLLSKHDFRALNANLHERQILVIRLRNRLQVLIDIWPMAFEPEDLKVAQALLDEIAEAEP